MKLTRRATAKAFMGAVAVSAAPSAAWAGSGFLGLGGSTKSGDANFEADRKAILAMAGDYHVQFDFRETVSFLPGYTPIPAKKSGGHEVIRAIEDTGETIRLQHILVGEHEGKIMLVKHWRQDWIYQPQSVLTYSRKNVWAMTDIARGDRRGAWAQTVWQTDDSPRYGGVGRWMHDAGVSRWTSNATLRPLARRDAVRHPAYDHYRGVNRHALTPKGWVHEQDNAKLGSHDGTVATFVHEVVLNSYDRFSDFKVAVAESYWEKTKGYWAAVRAGWDDVIASGGIRLEEEAENGSITGPVLMGLADQIAEGSMTQAAAIAQARAAISKATARV